MIETGIHTCYQGDLGEIRRSSLFKLHKDFEEKPSLSFKYVLAGQEAYIVDGKHISLQQGDALFFKEDKQYQAFVNSENATIGLCIDLNFDKAAVITDALQEQELFLFDPEFKTQRISFLHQNTHSILQKIGGEDNTDVLFLEESLQDLMSSVLMMEAEFQSKITSIPVKKNSYKKELFQRLLIAKNFIHDNMQQQIQLQDIAAASNLSSFYMHRLFRHVFGCSPTVYLEQLRMKVAQERLFTNRSVKEVAFSVGYTDEAYFSRRFKKCFGMAPKHFTKK
ncbi:MAG: AraC family transcriptional regulator [Bacteroidota bacterium]